jgi:hypothetical protein
MSRTLAKLGLILRSESAWFLSRGLSEDSSECVDLVVLVRGGEKFFRRVSAVSSHNTYHNP